MSDASTGSEQSGWRARVMRALAAHPAATGLGVGAVILAAAYVIVFEVTNADETFAGSVGSAIRNTAPALALAAGALAVLERFVIGRPAWVQTLAHGALAAVFAVLWYVAVITLLGLRSGSLSEGFEVFPFSVVAFSWQMFQGVVLYGVVGVGAYALALLRRSRVLEQALDEARAETAAARASPGAGAGEAAPRRLLVRTEEGLTSLDVADIVQIAARDDYAEIVTRDGAHLARRSLASLEAALPGRFVRAHRSHLINLDAVDAAEPAGDGRLTLHLANGVSLVTSRAGAQRVRGEAL